MRDDDAPLDESRMIRGPGLLAVYVPPKPLPRPDDYKRDFPPGYPPEVHYDGVRANYWVVLDERQMPFMSGTKVFNDEQMAWLQSVKEVVERVMRGQGRSGKGS